MGSESGSVAVQVNCTLWPSWTVPPPVGEVIATVGALLGGVVTVIWNACVSVPAEFVAVTVIVPVVPAVVGVPESVFPESVSRD